LVFSSFHPNCNRYEELVISITQKLADYFLFTDTCRVDFGDDWYIRETGEL